MIVNTQDTIDKAIRVKAQQEKYRAKPKAKLKAKEYRADPNNKEKARIYMKAYMQKKRAKELEEKVTDQRLHNKEWIVKKSIQHIKNLLKPDEYENLLRCRSKKCMQNKRKQKAQDLIDKKRLCEY